MLNVAALGRVTGRVHREEAGAIWVWLALVMPVAAVMAAFVIDVAHWFEHERHLQTQVDAAALAGGGKFSYPNCTDTVIENEALKYAGDLVRLPSAYNQQVSNQTNVHVLFNSPGFWTSNSSSSLENTDTGGGPCTAEHLDVKATDSNVPLFFGGLFPGLTPTVHAHARVSIKVLNTLSGSLPLALPDPTPRQARAYFVDETTGNPIIDPATSQPMFVPLFFNANNGGLDYWSSTDTSVSPSVNHTVTIPSMPVGNVGIRIALSGSTTNIQCGQNLVVCYDDGSGVNTAPTGTSPLYGIDNVRVYDPSIVPNTSSASAALVMYGTKLTTADCSNPYFVTADCSVTLYAWISLPAGTTIAGNNKLTVEARLDGATQNNKQAQMSTGTGCPALPAPPAGAQCWVSQPIAVSASADGWHTVNVAWQDTKSGDPQCNSASCDDTGQAGSIAQRIFVASGARTGQVQWVDLIDSNGTQADQTTPILSTAYHSYALGGSTGQIGVRVGLTQSFSTAAPNSTPVTLRFGTGGQTQAIDCNPSTGPYATQYGNQFTSPPYSPNYTSFSGELQFGCIPNYTKWDGTPCPGATSPALYPGTRNDLWNSTTQPWMCADTETGETPADIGQGLNSRILLAPKPTACPPMETGLDTTTNHHDGHNYWDPTGSSTWSSQLLDPADPRIVTVMLAPYGTFAGSGQQTYPITRFAAFYVTGWQGNNGFNNPCQNPGGGDDPAPVGAIVGHFMSYTEAINKGGGGSDDCSVGGVDVCVAVLTQ